MRVFRQWRNLKLRKWFGTAYEDRDPGPGDLAGFCAACPQSEINLREDWESDIDGYEIIFMRFNSTKNASRYKYSRDLVLDGNFSADQTKMKRPDDDVHLTNGDGFMVRESSYQDHIRTAQEVKQVRTT